MDDFVAAISTVGFPIVSYLISACFIKYTYDKQADREIVHDKQDEARWNQLAELTQAVHENSEAIRELVGEIHGKD